MSETATVKAAEETKPLTLSQKILNIQATVGTVKKNGTFGSEMGGSKYLRIEDTVYAVGKLMSAKKLILTGTLLKCDRVPHEKTGKDGNLSRSGYIANVLMQWTLEDTETGELRNWTFPGDGYDGTDKAVYKAMTGSRKYAIINIFNLAVGNDVEAVGFEPEKTKNAQKNVAAQKIADAAGRGNKTAIEAMSQIEPEKKILIQRPETFNGHYIAVSGLIAIPQLDVFFQDTGSTRFQPKNGGSPYWRVPSDYEVGLMKLCEKLGIEVEG